MSLAQITLTTNKSISSVGDYVRKIGQGEKGQILPVLVTDANGSAYDLTGKNLVFSENKVSGAIIVDDGSDVNSGKFTPVDLKNGRFDYTLQKQVYMEDGTCWFDIVNQDGTVVDTTRSFEFVVIPDAKIHVNSDSYVSSLDGLIAHVNSAGNKAIEDINNLVTQLTNEVNAKKSEADNISSQLTKKFDDKMTDLNNQLSDYQAKYNKLSTDWANKLKTISDQATSDINAKYAQKLVDLQNDYNSWKNKTVADFNATVDPIKQSIQKNTADVANITKQVQDALAQMNTLKQEFDRVDFTKFVTGDQIKNYYTKTEVNNIVADLNAKIATAGKVKTVDNIQPDSNGNIQTDHYTKDQANQKLAAKLTFVKCDSPQAAYDASKKPADDGSLVIGIYDPDNGPTQAVIGDKTITISGLYESLQNLQTQVSGLSSLQSVVDGKANSADVYLKTDIDNTVNHLKDLIANAGKVKTVNGTQPDNTGNISIAIPDISSKADKTDVNNLSNRITALENKKPIKASSQDDAVAKSQSSNNEYYW